MDASVITKLQCPIERKYIFKNTLLIGIALSLAVISLFVLVPFLLISQGLGLYRWLS